MNQISNITPQKEIVVPKEKTAGTLNKEDLSLLVKEERPQKMVGKGADATSALVSAESKNTSKSIKQAFVSFFDKSVKEDVQKFKHEKQIKSFFKSTSLKWLMKINKRLMIRST